MAKTSLLSVTPDTQKHTHTQTLQPKSRQEAGAACARASAQSPIRPTCAAPKGGARPVGWQESSREAPGWLSVCGREDRRRLERATLGDNGGDFHAPLAFLPLLFADRSVSSPTSPAEIRSPAPRPRSLPTAWPGPWNPGLDSVVPSAAGAGRCATRWGRKFPRLSGEAEAESAAPPSSSRGRAGPWAQRGLGCLSGGGGPRLRGAAAPAGGERDDAAAQEPLRELGDPAPQLLGPRPLAVSASFPLTPPPGRPSPRPSRLSSSSSSHSSSNSALPAARRPCLAPCRASPRSQALLARAHTHAHTHACRAASPHGPPSPRPS